MLNFSAIQTWVVVCCVVFCTNNIIREREETISRESLLINTVDYHITISCERYSLSVDTVTNVPQVNRKVFEDVYLARADPSTECSEFVDYFIVDCSGLVDSRKINLRYWKNVLICINMYICEIDFRSVLHHFPFIHRNKILWIMKVIHVALRSKM